MTAQTALVLSFSVNPVMSLVGFWPRLALVGVGAVLRAKGTQHLRGRVLWLAA